MPTYYLIYSRFVDTTVIKSAVILTSLRPGIVSTSWCRHGDFVLELARMHRVERCGHGTNLERRTPYEKQMDMATYCQKNAVSLDVMREGFFRGEGAPEAGRKWI